MIAKYLSKLIPESNLKKKLRYLFQFAYFPYLCFKQNYFCNNDFNMVYKNGIFTYSFRDSVSLRAYDDLRFDLGVSLRGFLMNYKPKKGDIIIDGGAHKGGLAIYLAKIVGINGRVLAFEPDPLNFKRLVKNIKLNKLNNVIALNKGLWNENTFLSFHRSISTRSSLFYGNNADKKTAYKVPVVKLDDEVKRLNIDKVDFIKMDIEGAEIKAVMGTKKILERKRVNVAIASYHKVDGKPTYIFLENFFPNKLGYNVHTSYPQHLTTYASKRVIPKT